MATCMNIMAGLMIAAAVAFVWLAVIYVGYQAYVDVFVRAA